MKNVLKVTVALTLLPLLIAVSYLPIHAQNTAPVPTTFEILSPSDGSQPFLANMDYTTNNAIFYGGDLANSGTLYPAFLGGLDANGDRTLDGALANGNPHNTRLTLGGMRETSNFASGNMFARIVNMPGAYSGTAGSFDADDVGAAVAPDYTGMNGFIAINEEDSLVIRLTGYADPNNPSKAISGATYSGAQYQSVKYAYDSANPANDSANGVRFGVLPSTLPAGATFNTDIFSWTPNFIQGDGTHDNSVRGGRFFVDANISNGTTTSQTSLATNDTISSGVGLGLGELKDSLYVVYFMAMDDGIPPLTGMDSLFILVNDSIANPPPVFTKHEVVRPQGTVQSYKASVDSVLHYSEGDSIQITYYAADQDSIRGGGANQALRFNVTDWSGFLRRTDNHWDSLALSVDTLKAGSTVTGFKVRLQVAYNVADTVGAGYPDTVSLQVRVLDESNNADTSTVRFVIANINRPPIWDPDTSSKPTDSTLTYAYDPAAVDADSVPAFSPLAVSNGAVDSILFTSFVYDPDPLIADSLGPAITFSTTSSLGTVFNANGLLVVNLTSEDTTSHEFPITAIDSDPTAPQSSAVTLTLRVAPTPEVESVYPGMGYPGQDITIFGSGFGLMDVSSITPSRVIFRARNSGGSAQNLRATINSWSRDRINVTIPPGTPASQIDIVSGNYIPDTIEVYSSVFSSPTYFPYVIAAADTNTVFDMEISNITSTSATIKWRTAFSGGDSVIVATFGDTLQVNTIAGISPAPQYSDDNSNYPVFVVKNASGAATTHLSTVNTFRGASQSTDQIHAVDLTGLNPGTSYRFIIAMDNRLFFGDSSGNLNGPYKPAKINRSFTGNTAIGAFKFETAPSQNSNGDVFVVGGDVFTPTSAAYGALVTIRIVDSENLADTTMPLTATVGSDSAWVIDLGNALIDTSGTVNRQYSHKAGDYLIVTVNADKEDGYVKFVTTRAATQPQTISYGSGAGILLSPVVDYDVRFLPGLNLVGIPVNLFANEPQTAKELLGEITGGAPSITRYVSATSTLETIIKTISAGSDPYIGAADWNLADADGNYYNAFFVSVDNAEYVNLSGSVYGTTLDPIEFANAGLYWIARPAQISSLFYAWDAKSVLANVLNAEQISRFNEETQSYEDAYIDASDGSFRANVNFHIDPSEGYVLKVSAASQWDINTPVSVLLANTSQKFDNTSGVSPALTLNVSGAAVTQGVSNINLSDVTSAAAKISWIGATSGAKIRYGKASQGITHYVDYQPGDNLTGAGVQVLTGLEAETEYVYEIVANGVTYNDNGKPFMFTTSKVGIGIPYTVYGRLADESGMPLAGALVFLQSNGKNDQQSRLVAAVTDADGYWNVNLANLKLADGSVYEWSNGDELRISAVFGSASTSFRTLVSGNSPQNVVRVAETDGAASQDKNQVAQVSLPKAFTLGQNFPNPFNPSTTIAYDIPDTETSVKVQLRVYNVRGQVVRTLVDADKDAGHYVVQWDGRNEKGENVASGVYFYRIKAGDFVTTRKMVLLK